MKILHTLRIGLKNWRGRRKLLKSVDAGLRSVATHPGLIATAADIGPRDAVLIAIFRAGNGEQAAGFLAEMELKVEALMRAAGTWEASAVRARMVAAERHSFEESGPAPSRPFPN